jgi:hypothetical protein
MFSHQLLKFLLPFRYRAHWLKMRMGKQPVLIAPGRCGFFGNLFITLNGIRLAESAGVNGIPNWDYRCLYFDPERGGNAWNYYFESPDIDSNFDRLHATSTWELPPSADTIFPLYPNLCIRQSYTECIRRHIRLRQDVQEEFNELRYSLFGNQKFIGVHIRHTDAAANHEDRSVAELVKYCQIIDRRLDDLPDHELFIATDSVSSLEYMNKRYGKRVFAIDCIRSEGLVSIHGHYDDGVKGSPYQKGIEVIYDALLLASTKHLIRTHSRVTEYSLCVNPNLTFDNVMGDTDLQRAPWLK